MDSKMSLSSASLATHLRLLRWCGYCRLAGGARLARLHALYRALTLALTTVYLLQECVYAYQVQQDMDKLARVMFLLLCHITSIAKQLVFHLKAERIDEMLAGLEDPLYNQPEEAHRRLLGATAASASRFVRAYSGCAVVTCTLWITFPVMYRLQGLPVEFPFWITVDYNRPTMFILVLAYSYYVTTLVGIANTTMDAFMATVLNQCKTQLRLLRMNFECLPERAAVLSRQLGGSYDAALFALFRECLVHYEKITETAKMLQNIFGTAILIQFGIGGWILCMAAYKIVSLNMLSVEFASMALFISCILTELFLYCYYGNEVTDESERVSQSLYSMEWRRARLTFRRSLVLVMERAKRPLRPAAGRVIPLSLDTFVKIIKSSYTFYAVLRQTK
uniref:Odorant receptor n=2 Tax=Helicoverpa armigera TaxID=29058 RepID=A0A075T2X6_HELAM|nr:odorant receptor [Helicoverpa armigera]QPX50343.1 odorant receptor [Helicoverpa armigera]